MAQYKVLESAESLTFQVADSSRAITIARSSLSVETFPPQPLIVGSGYRSHELKPAWDRRIWVVGMELVERQKAIGGQINWETLELLLRLGDEFPVAWRQAPGYLLPGIIRKDPRGGSRMASLYWNGGHLRLGWIEGPVSRGSYILRHA